MNNRYEQLDSIRGIAALTVLVHHFFSTFPAFNIENIPQSDWLSRILAFSPLHILWAGHEAVILFFVLSGFVLALPFLKDNNNFLYRAYIVKRICRIYIPYICAIFIAIISIHFFYKGNISELSVWFNEVGQKNINLNLVLQHVLFIGFYDNWKFNPVLWSLIHEMRISIIFPIIMFFVLRFDWRKNLIIGFITTELIYRIGKEFFEADIWLTFHYIQMFIIGAILAKHRVLIIEKCTNIKAKTKVYLFIAASFIYSLSWSITNIKFKISTNHWLLLKKLIWNTNEYIVAIAVVIFIILALSSQKISSILLNKRVNFLGKISYSLYLYHAICLTFFIYLLYNKIPIMLILTIVAAASIIISSLSYFYIELPSIKLAKFLSELPVKKQQIKLKRAKIEM